MTFKFVYFHEILSIASSVEPMNILAIITLPLCIHLREHLLDRFQLIYLFSKGIYEAVVVFHLEMDNIFKHYRWLNICYPILV